MASSGNPFFLCCYVNMRRLPQLCHFETLVTCGRIKWEELIPPKCNHSLCYL